MRNCRHLLQCLRVGHFRRSGPCDFSVPLATCPKYFRFFGLVFGFHLLNKFLTFKVLVQTIDREVLFYLTVVIMINLWLESCFFILLPLLLLLYLFIWLFYNHIYISTLVKMKAYFWVSDRSIWSSGPQRLALLALRYWDELLGALYTGQYSYPSCIRGPCHTPDYRPQSYWRPSRNDRTQITTNLIDCGGQIVSWSTGTSFNFNK